MSLAKAVLRNLTVLSLVGKTLAGPEVTSSNLTPINDMKPGDNDRPVIAVFTDTAKATSEQVEGRDILGANEVVTLALEIAVFAAPPATDADGGEIGIPPTDEGMELAIDIIQRQSVAELQAGTSAWPDLWRQFVFRVVGTATERGVAITNGVRFAARRFEMHVEIINDPIPGQALPASWAAAITALEADSRTAAMGALIRSIADGVALPPWQQIKGELGITDAAARMVSIGPFAGSDADDGGIRPATVVAGDDIDRSLTVTVDVNGATIGTTDADGATPLDEPPHGA
jgi:hypothetical protein